jgi:hypothetical protein
VARSRRKYGGSFHSSLKRAATVVVIDCSMRSRSRSNSSTTTPGTSKSRSPSCTVYFDVIVSESFDKIVRMDFDYAMPDDHRLDCGLQRSEGVRSYVEAIKRLIHGCGCHPSW